MTDRMSEDRFWIENSRIDRRSVIRGGAYAAGFALACQPISAATIQTSGEGLVQENTAFRATDGFSLPAFIARPASNKPAPIIVVVHEVFGVHEWVKDMCRRFAKAGYYAIAPDLFARAGDATKVADMKTLFSTIVSPTSDAQVMADIDTAYAWAGSHGGDGRYRGISGFCWGGRIVWLYAAHSPKLNAGVAFYGRLVGEPTTLQPQSPLERAANLHAPVLGQYGGKDKGISAADIETMLGKLKELHKAPPSSITIYPEAEHGFMADYRPSYNEAAAKQAWGATLEWFARYIKK
ncbi:MAG TPA: dienelactone hydrolase family protein [Sphingobium sp.]|uniref:dienelactone hydrolase family protein n=1 Tax=Sphingobium sp. TaxID=1912891 RepID=UPI002ED189C6